METDCGSLYGEGIYSAAVYSFETCWSVEVCVPISREPVYVPPAVVNWQQLECVPLTER